MRIRVRSPPTARSVRHSVRCRWRQSTAKGMPSPTRRPKPTIPTPAPSRTAWLIRSLRRAPRVIRTATLALAAYAAGDLQECEIGKRDDRQHRHSPRRGRQHRPDRRDVRVLGKIASPRPNPARRRSSCARTMLVKRAFGVFNRARLHEGGATHGGRAPASGNITPVRSSRCQKRGGRTPMMVNDSATLRRMARVNGVTVRVRPRRRVRRSARARHDRRAAQTVPRSWLRRSCEDAADNRHDAKHREHITTRPSPIHCKRHIGAEHRE